MTLSRRDFLVSTTTAAAGTTVAMSSPAQAAPTLVAQAGAVAPRGTGHGDCQIGRAHV